MLVNKICFANYDGIKVWTSRKEQSYNLTYFKVRKTFVKHMKYFIILTIQYITSRAYGNAIAIKLIWVA